MTPRERVLAALAHRRPDRTPFEFIFTPPMLETFRRETGALDPVEYFDLDIPSPYMLMIANVLEEKKVIIPSVTHVDGTARLQSVLKELNPEFYLLIQAFQKITGIPIVLNTSFNVNKKPIVETPGDALSCFLKTDLDELYIHNYRIKKR